MQTGADAPMQSTAVFNVEQFKAVLARRDDEYKAALDKTEARDASQNERDAKQNEREAKLKKSEADFNALCATQQKAMDERDAKLKAREAKRETKLDAPILPPASSFAVDPFNGVYPTMNLRFVPPLSPYSVANAADAKSADQANKLTSFLDTVESVATTIDVMQLADIPRLKDPHFILPERPAPNSGSQYERQALHNFFGFKEDATLMKTAAERMRTNIKLASQARLAGELSRTHAAAVHNAIGQSKSNRKTALKSAREARSDLLAKACAL